MIVHALIGPMAGEISPNIMFFKNNQKECGRLRMGAHGCGYRTTRGHEAKIDGQDMFCRCGHVKQK